MTAKSSTGISNRRIYWWRSRGVIKVADFGIARGVASTTVTTMAGTGVMGSVHYFSPEQARGRHMDHRTDIYALGIVLYEMITGHLPFEERAPSRSPSSISRRMSGCRSGTPARSPWPCGTSSTKPPGARRKNDIRTSTA